MATTPRTVDPKARLDAVKDFFARMRAQMGVTQANVVIAPRPAVADTYEMELKLGDLLDTLHTDLDVMRWNVQPPTQKDLDQYTAAQIAYHALWTLNRLTEPEKTDRRYED